MSQTALICVFSALFLAGCHHEPPAPYRVFSPPPTPRVVSDKPKEPADIYVSLGREALTALPEPQSATYTPGYKDLIRKKAAPLIARLVSASSKPVVLQERVRPMDEPLDVEAGWVRLGHAMAWTIESDIDAGQIPAAVSLTITAHRFAFDLTHGDIAQAQTGLAIADLARNSIAPDLAKLSPGDLKALADGITAALPRLATTEQTLTAEKPDQMAILQAIQDAYKDKKTLDQMETKAYNDTRDAWTYLRRMSEDERGKYFDQFSAEVDDSNAMALAESKKTQAIRDPDIADWIKEKGKVKYRPWKRLIPHYFLTWQDYLDQYDLTLARTRMLGITALVVQGIKASGSAPDVMTGAPDILKTDPFSGKPFGYAHASTDYKVYSVGADGRDDGGSSDKAGTDPDVLLLGVTNGN